MFDTFNEYFSFVFYLSNVVFFSIPTLILFMFSSISISHSLQMIISISWDLSCLTRIVHKLLQLNAMHFLFDNSPVPATNLETCLPMSNKSVSYSLAEIEAKSQNYLSNISIHQPASWFSSITDSFFMFKWENINNEAKKDANDSFSPLSMIFYNLLQTPN